MTADLTTDNRVIDADVHPRLPLPSDLAAYMEPYWREAVELRGIESWESISYPTHAPLTHDPAIGMADTDPVALARHTLGAGADNVALLNTLFPVTTFRDANLGAAFARACNDWLADRFLTKEPRFRGSLLIPWGAPDLAVAEIERWKDDHRFVQILGLVFGERPLGHRAYWPIYEAAERYGFAIGVHAGSSYHHAVTGSGWPSYLIEDYAAQAIGFHTQLGSFIVEGVFVKFPTLKVVMIESGVTWAPPYLWRLAKFWRGVRLEAPWLERPPLDFVKSNVRFTTQPFDGPLDAGTIARLVDQLGSDEILLYASDTPHHHAVSSGMLLNLLPATATRRILSENAAATYARLGGGHAT